MIEDILPGVVSAVEAFTDPPGATLFPEEEAVIAAAVARRRQEFATVRSCARAALARLGYPPAPILPGPRDQRAEKRVGRRAKPAKVRNEKQRGLAR